MKKLYITSFNIFAVCFCGLLVFKLIKAEKYYDKSDYYSEKFWETKNDSTLNNYEKLNKMHSYYDSSNMCMDTANKITILP